MSSREIPWRATREISHSSCTHIGAIHTHTHTHTPTHSSRKRPRELPVRWTTGDLWVVGTHTQLVRAQCFAIKRVCVCVCMCEPHIDHHMWHASVSRCIHVLLSDYGSCRKIKICAQTAYTLPTPPADALDFFVSFVLNALNDWRIPIQRYRGTI